MFYKNSKPISYIEWMMLNVYIYINITVGNQPISGSPFHCDITIVYTIHVNRCTPAVGWWFRMTWEHIDGTCTLHLVEWYAIMEYVSASKYVLAGGKWWGLIRLNRYDCYTFTMRHNSLYGTELIVRTIAEHFYLRYCEARTTCSIKMAVSHKTLL